MADRPESEDDRTKRLTARGQWSVLPTVRDVLQLPMLLEALPEVLAGRDALDRPVRWVHVSESLTVAKLLDGGELLLATGAGWSLDGGQIGDFIADLVRVGAVGLVLELVQRFDCAPSALLEACALHGFPLIVLHREVKFVAVTEAVHRRIIAVQTSALRARDEVRELFTGLSLRGSPADFIVQQLSRALQSPVVLENLGHEVIVVEGEGISAGVVLDDWERKSRTAHRNADYSRKDVTAPSAEDWIVVPVEARGVRWGALIALPGQPHPAGRLAVLEQGAIALALGKLADGDSDEWLRIGHQHLLDALLGGRYANSIGLTARLEAAGLPVAGRTLVGLGVSSRPQTLPLSATAAAGAAAMSIGGRAIAGIPHSAAWPTRAPGMEASGVLAVCLSLPSRNVLDDRELERFVRRFAAAAGIDADLLSIGVGSTASEPGGLFASLQESMELLGRVRGSGPTMTIQRSEDRPLLRLVTALRDDPRVQEHAQHALRPLIEYDLSHASDLLAVLTAILAHPTSRTAAASASHLSRSVFYQRLALIGTLLGVDLEDGETLASLQVALLSR